MDLSVSGRPLAVESLAIGCLSSPECEIRDRLIIFRGSVLGRVPQTKVCRLVVYEASGGPKTWHKPRVIPHAMTMPSIAEKLLNKIQARQARVGVVGLGYVGLPLAVEFARGEFAVT